jgi:hypothetical protein
VCSKPLAIDLFCGLGGWTEGLLAEGYRVVGFDNERHVYGEARYPAQLVIQDVLTLHGRQFKDAALIVASPPCQEYSYRAMPWKKAKALGPPDNTLFEACFRIQAEAVEAAGHHIPLVVENVCGAQKWVGRARWHYGSFYLWGDVPALMPNTRKHIKVPTMGAGWYPPGHPKHVPGLAFNGHADRNLRDGIKAGDRNKARGTGGHEWTTGFDKHIKNNGGSWFNVAHNTTSGNGQNPTHRRISEGWRAKHYDSTAKMQIAGDGVKKVDNGYTGMSGWWNGHTWSKNTARKAASAHIAKIPLALSRHIAQAWR